MKKFYYLLIFVFISNFSFSQNEFITTWEVTNFDLNVFINVESNLYNYNYSVDFGDGVVINNLTDVYTHTYSSAGIYTIVVTGIYPYIRLSSSKLKSVEQWGDNQWESMEFMFSNSTNMILNANDTPNLSQVTNMTAMFNNCSSFNQSIDNWDVSNVTNMSNMFSNCSSFNQSINNWDVSNVTDMSNMFSYCHSFNQPLNNWDVSSVNEMGSMFANASLFNQSIDVWDVSNVTDMNSMFIICPIFNQPLNSWNVSNVTNMVGMFAGASSFNQSIDNWDVSNVINMDSMFSNCTLFNQPLNSWNVSNVTNMSSMFISSTEFNQALNNWDVSNVIDMSSMFFEALSFNQELDNWDVSNVTNMNSMFKGCNLFNQPLNNWNVSSVTGMESLFSGCNVFNQPLNNWDVSNTNTMNLMFANCNLFNQPLNNWDVSNTYGLVGMFNEASSFNQDLSSWVFYNGSNNLNLYFFISYTNLSTSNYESLLLSLASSGITNEIIGVHQLEYCNIAARDYLISQGWIFDGDNLSTDCNSVIGTFYFDLDANGCSNTDIEVSNVFIKAENISGFSTSINVLNADYILPVNSGSHTVSLLNLPTYFTASPLLTTVDFSTTSTEQVDFCLTKNQTAEDLNITLVTLEDARPGFTATYKLVVENVGTEIMNAVTASFMFDDTMQSFISANPNAASTTANSLNFNLGTINPFQTAEVLITMQTFTPPTVNGDDILNFTASVLPNATDFTPNDNTYDLQQIVVNAYDPNDKRVMQGDEISISEAGEYLDYIIRFQNTGSANATFVRIEEELDTELDWSTLKIISASHPYEVKVANGNDVEFFFDNINLPFEAVDPAGSNGYIAYKIKPKSTVQIGDVMSGDASIYFDYNLPIITNVASTTIVSNLSVEEFSLESLISIYPNPVQNELYLNVKKGVTVNTLKIYDLQGHVLIETKAKTNIINTDKLASGIYMLTVNTNQGTLSKKIIKK
jgi:surface protein